MRKAVLFYNPLSGRRRERRISDIEKALTILRSAGVDASATPTRAASDAGDQVRAAIADGCYTIFACGGDGTVHDVLQGVVGTAVPLGIIPLGTANALACDLNLPMSPAAAARAALTAEPRRIAVGRVEYLDFSGNRCSRYFTVAVGVGVDAHLFYKLNTGMKGRLGMAAYYAKAWHLWLTHRMRQFSAEYKDELGGVKHVNLTELLAVRIQNFGGVLRELAPGASLERDDLRLVLCQTSSRIAYLKYVMRSLLGAAWQVRGVELTYARQIACESLAVEDSGAVSSSEKVYIEADGELLGTLPAEISMAPDVAMLLVPTKQQ